MSDKRPRHSSAGDGLHHRSFNFDESVRFHRAPQRLHQFAALQKNVAHARIHDEIDIALAVTQFHVSEPVPLLGQGQKILAEERYLLHMDREFAGARAKQIAADANVVSDIEQLVQLEAGIADCVFFHVNLQPLAALLQVAESRLAHQPDRHNAAGHPHCHARLLQLLRRPVRVLRQNLRNGVREFVFAPIRSLAQCLNLFQFLAP